jgi:PAS domain S-box-containing protein
MRSVGRAQSTASNERDLLRAVCEQLVATGGYRLAWVGYAIDDEECTVRPMAQAGDDSGYLEQIRVVWRDDAKGRGPTGTAIRSGRAVVARDITSDTRFEPWRSETTERGFHSSIALPLVIDGRCAGALSLYSENRDGFDDDEQALLAELAAMVAQAIAGVRAQEEREQAIRALRESEERFQQIAECVQEGFWIASADDYRVLYMNAAFETLWGLSREAIYRDRREFEKWIHPDDRARVREAVDRSPYEYSVEYRLIVPERGVRWIWIRAFPIRDEHGRVIRIAGTGQDITERKDAEEERRRLEAQLEEVRRLEGLSRLAGGVAHDFNNLLGVIMNYTSIALRHLPEQHPARADLKSVLDTAQHAARLTNQLVLFSRNAEIAPERVDVNASIERMLHVLQSAAGEHVAVSFQLDPATPCVSIVPSHLEQILLNVVVNAKEATPHGGSIFIETQLVDVDAARAARAPGLAPGRAARISVRDTGRGMSSAQRARAFEPFYSTKEGAQASGLGLAIVYGCVQQAHGSIVLESVEGEGSRVEILLPALGSMPG